MTAGAGARPNPDQPASAIGYAGIKEGLPAEVLARFLAEGHLRRADVERVIAPRTLNRRLGAGQRLKIEEADAILRLMRVRAHAVDALGDAETAERWLAEPSPELGGETPLEMARTDVGAREVEAVLTRFEHGVVG